MFRSNRRNRKPKPGWSEAAAPSSSPGLAVNWALIGSPFARRLRRAPGLSRLAPQVASASAYRTPGVTISQVSNSSKVTDGTRG